MKKGILLVLAALLIAGLFVSCNSDVATNKSGSEKDVAYVSFGNNGAKGLSTNTVMPVDPVIDDLDWYFKATKNSGIIHTGEVTTWTCINTAGGLSGIIGPFAVGNWTFELVAVNHGATAPSTETYYDGTWHYGSKVVYVGRNANVDLVANTSSTPTLIAIALERVNVPTNTVFEVNANGIKLLDSSTDSFGSGNVYYTLVIGTGTNVVGVKTKTLVEVSAKTTAYVPASPETGYVYTPTDDGEIVQITLNIYESNAENAQIVKSATTSVAAFKGSIITISGSSDAIDAYATLDAGNNVACIISGSNAPVFFISLKNAIDAANNGDEVVLLKNISSFEGASVSKNITLNGNFHTLAGTGKDYASVNGQLASQTNKALLVIEPEAGSFSVKNITINGTDKGIAVRNGVESLTITNSTINTSGNAYNSPIRLERNLSKTDTGYDTEELTPILLTINNSTLTSSSYYAVYTFLPLETGSTISSSFISGYCALYFKPGCAGSVLSVSNSTLTGTNTSAGFSNGFATISFEEGGNNITLTNSILNAISSGNAQAMWAIQDSQWRWILKDITRSNEGNTVTVTGGHVNGDFYTNRNNLYYGSQDGYSYSASTITVTDKSSRTDIELDGTVQWDGNNVVMKSRGNLPLMSSIGANGKFCFDYYSVDAAPATYTHFYSFTEKAGWSRLTYEGKQASIWTFSRN